MSNALEQAIAHHRRGDVAGARKAAEAGLRGAADQPLLLHFLGMLESGAGNLAQARRHLERASKAAPANLPVQISLARVLARLKAWEDLAALPVHEGPPLNAELADWRAQAHARLGRWQEAAEDWRRIADERPDDPAPRIAAARAFVEAAAFDAGEQQYRAALSIDPASEPALLGLAGLLESLNRPRELDPSFAAAEAAGADRAVLAYGEAIRLREAGEHASALDSLRDAETILPPGTYHQLRGELLDRLDQAEAAFDAFTAMNDADAEAAPTLRAEATAYRSDVMRQLDQVRPGLTTNSPEERPPPVFLIGFPRSGTTLLDTFLMGHPHLQVHEERPLLDEAFRGLPDDPASWGPEQLSDARERYWRAVDAEGKGRALLHVDKSPLASSGAHLIHRLFPNARFLFALRHPCDVVLSCFITRFRLNRGTAAFLDLREAAEQYDAVMQVWSAARSTLGLQVHDVPYEQLVVDPDKEIRAAMAFVDVPFDEKMLDHQQTARTRGMITTPSHAQVAAPLSARPSGRWLRYRRQLEAVLPLLEPWCQRFGYSLLEPSTP